MRSLVTLKISHQILKFQDLALEAKIMKKKYYKKTLIAQETRNIRFGL